MAVGAVYRLGAVDAEQRQREAGAVSRRLTHHGLHAAHHVATAIEPRQRILRGKTADLLFGAHAVDRKPGRLDDDLLQIDVVGIP